MEYERNTDVYQYLRIGLKNCMRTSETNSGRWHPAYGGIVEEDKIRIYAIKIATSDTAHALGFDDSREQWQHLASVDAGDLAADSQLDAVLDEWAQDSYGSRFEILKPR